MAQVTSAAEASTIAQRDRWLLLIHQLPAKPAYVRVKIWRRLQALGAVAVKNAVHALPASEHGQEDFEWLLKEIVDSGGEAVICEARLIDGLSDSDVRELHSMQLATPTMPTSAPKRARYRRGWLGHRQANRAPNSRRSSPA
jgi:hypothetical protein